MTQSRKERLPRQFIECATTQTSRIIEVLALALDLLLSEMDFSIRKDSIVKTKAVVKKVILAQ